MPTWVEKWSVEDGVLMLSKGLMDEFVAYPLHMIGLWGDRIEYESYTSGEEELEEDD